MSRSGLLLVDVLDDYHHEDGKQLLRSFRARAAALAQLVSGARRSDAPIVYANDNRGVWDGDAGRLVREALHGPAGDLIAEICPRPADRFVVKPRYSAFDMTPLGLLLGSLTVKRIVVAGAATELCVFHTALAAQQQGFETAVVPQACATVDPEKESTALAYLERISGIALLDLEQAIMAFAGS